MTANTWLARLQALPDYERSVVLDYLNGLNEAGPMPDFKWITERLAEYDKQGQHEQT